MINDVALKHGISWVYGGAIASSGMTMTIIPGKSPCFRCVSPVLPEFGARLTCETVGVVGTVPAIIGSLQATEAMKILVGSEEINRELIMIDVWKRSFNNLKLGHRDNCPACHGKYDFLENRFVMKTTSFCGQSRAVQVVNTEVTEIDLDELARRLRSVDDISNNEFMLHFSVDDKEIIVFPDGRAIIKNTIDESLAKELYVKYIGNLK